LSPTDHQPFVSVILPVRNRERSIARAIDSVLAQTYRDFELIVVDDGSTDSSADIAATYGDALTLLRRPAEGAYAARNAALARASGELIAFADSDDAWLPRKLELQVPLLSREAVGLVFGDAIHVVEPTAGAPPNGTTSFGASPPRRGKAARALAWRNFVPTPTVLVRRSCLVDVGGFPNFSRVSADYLVWFRIALRRELDYVDEAVCIYTFNRDSISFDLGRSLEARIELFSGELENARARTERSLLRRLLFNSSLHLVLAALRGKAASVEGPLGLALRTAWRSAGVRSLPWTAAFVAHQIWLRGRRLGGAS
jgi:glycosyltransferase involved in cell wall biosynthesis